jgi:hypothetical protein
MHALQKKRKLQDFGLLISAGSECMVSDMPVRVGLLVTESFPRTDLSSLSF